MGNVGLKEVCDGGLGFSQPSGRRLDGESRQWIVLGGVAFVLEFAEEVGEGPGAD